MKILSIIKITETKGQLIASILCERGIIFKSKEVINVFRKPGSRFWRFLKGGNFTPNYVMENMYSAYVAMENAGLNVSAEVPNDRDHGPPPTNLM